MPLSLSILVFYSRQSSIPAKYLLKVKYRTFTVLLSGAPIRVTLGPSQATFIITENNGRWDIVVV